MPPPSSPSPGSRTRTASLQTGTLVLGADIVYLSETYPLLLDTLVHLCKDRAVVYLSSKMREEHGTPGFYGDTLPQRFHVKLEHRDPTQNINIYSATLRGKQ